MRTIGGVSGGCALSRSALPELLRVGEGAGDQPWYVGRSFEMRNSLSWDSGSTLARLRFSWCVDELEWLVPSPSFVSILDVEADTALGTVGVEVSWGGSGYTLLFPFSTVLQPPPSPSSLSSMSMSISSSPGPILASSFSSGEECRLGGGYGGGAGLVCGVSLAIASCVASISANVGPPRYSATQHVLGDNRWHPDDWVREVRSSVLSLVPLTIWTLTDLFTGFLTEVEHGCEGVGGFEFFRHCLCTRGG